MSRAFSYAGCPTTVMSLWRISDKTTPEILEEFYQEISVGADIDQAMRHAKLEYLTNTSGTFAHPSYWAALVVHGPTYKVVDRTKVGVWILLLTMVLLAFVLHKARRKSNLSQ